MSMPAPSRFLLAGSLAIGLLCGVGLAPAVTNAGEASLISDPMQDARHRNDWVRAQDGLSESDASRQASRLGATGAQGGIEIDLLMGATPRLASSEELTRSLPEAVRSELSSARRMRAVQINPETIGLMAGDTLYLGLFDDVHLWAVIDRVATDVNGVRSIRGRIQNSEHGTVLLSLKDGKVLATIHLPEREQEYIISDFASSFGHLLREIDADSKDALEPSPVLLPPEALNVVPSRRGANSIGAEDQATIDLMIVYTPAAREWANSRATSIDHVINQAVQRNQMTLDNSTVGITMPLVRASEVDYTESGDSSWDHDLLTDMGDGEMDEVHAWRDTDGADLVSLFARVEDTGGLGWLGGGASYAFTLVRVQQAHTGYTLIHEIGHNMGAHHHKEQNYQPGPGRYSYSAGWRWTGQDGGRYCSVMTYESGRYFSDGRTHTEVPYFSNPNINYQGVPTGHATDADNARTLVNVKAIVAAYRAPTTTSPSGPSSLGAIAVSASRINLTWSDNSSNELGFRIEQRVGTGTWTQIGQVNANLMTYASTGLAAGTTYSYRVLAHNAAGLSAYSNEASATTPNGTATKPAAPGRLAAQAASRNQINLTWRDRSSNEQGFRIERKTGTAAWVQIAEVAANSTSFTNSGLSPNTSYRYRVRAFNDGGTSAFTAARTVKTPR